MKQVVIKIACCFVLLITTASVATPTHWTTIQPGLEYTRLAVRSGLHNGNLHAFRVNLANFDLDLAIAEDKSDKIAAVSDLTKASHGLVGVNGGFFSQELKPLGLRISAFKQRNPLKSTSWWGIFYIQDHHPYIVTKTEYQSIQHKKNIEFAVQSGPRLVISGKIPPTLKPGTDSRTAIGISSDQHVILVVTENLNLTTMQLAKLMLLPLIEGGLSCIQALNLDGGSSTQLYAKLANFSLEVKGFSAVTDAILVVPKKINKDEASG